MDSQTYIFTLSEDCYAGAKAILDKSLTTKADDPLAVASVNFPANNPRFRLQVDRKLKGDVWNISPGARSREAKETMAYRLPEGIFPDDLTRLVNLAFQEAISCYEISCFLAAIALCGRTIETVLGAAYQKVKGVHPSADSSKPGINAIINELKRQGHQLPTGLKEKMETIAIHRNMAIHGNLIIPTDDEARSAIYSTRDVLRYAAENPASGIKH
jgi:hypothetical protein